MQLGERALGSKLQEALTAGVDPGDIGRNLIEALSDHEEAPHG